MRTYTYIYAVFQVVISQVLQIKVMHFELGILSPAVNHTTVYLVRLNILKKLCI